MMKIVQNVAPLVRRRQVSSFDLPFLRHRAWSATDFPSSATQEFAGEVIGRDSSNLTCAKEKMIRLRDIEISPQHHLRLIENARDTITPGEMEVSSSNSEDASASVLEEAAQIQTMLKSGVKNEEQLDSGLARGIFSMSEPLVLEVLRRHRSNWKAAASFFYWAAAQEGYSHGSRAYNEMLDILGRMKQLKPMRQLFDEIPRDGSIADERTFAVLINRYAGAHKVADAIDVFYKRKDHGLAIDLSAFQRLLTALCRYKHVEEAEALFLKKKAEFPLVIRSRNIILNGWCVLGSLREAKRFWNDIVTSSDCKPDLYTYGIFINSLAKAGKLGTAVKLFTSMWVRGCSPDVAICNCIIDALCLKKQIPRAMEIFREMDGRGLLPDAATYNTLVKHLCGIGRLEEAESLVVEMQRRGCVPSARTFGYFLKAAKSGSEAAAVVSRMKRARCELDGDTWNQILNLYVRWDDQSGVAEVWSEMEKRGLGPDQRSYTVLIHGLHGRGRLEEASRAYVEMKSKGMIPEPRTNLLMRAIELVKKNGPGPDKEKPMSSRPTGPS